MIEAFSLRSFLVASTAIHWNSKFVKLGSDFVQKWRNYCEICKNLKVPKGTGEVEETAETEREAF